jgi:hypothetical protein
VENNRELSIQYLFLSSRAEITQHLRILGLRPIKLPYGQYPLDDVHVIHSSDDIDRLGYHGIFASRSSRLGEELYSVEQANIWMRACLYTRIAVMPVYVRSQ